MIWARLLFLSNLKAVVLFEESELDIKYVSFFCTTFLRKIFRCDEYLPSFARDLHSTERMDAWVFMCSVFYCCPVLTKIEAYVYIKTS
jgi:hypothetical protein